MYNILIVKYGEIGVKGKNRYIFENKLIKNVKNILKPIGKFNVYKEYGRIYVDLDGYDYEEVVEEVKKVFGIVGVCPAVRAEKDYNLLKELALKMLEEKIEQGCALRCKYCHNRDTWDTKSGKEYTTDEVITQALKYKSYMNASGGGITVSGGEATLQPEFLNELFIKAKENKIHTCLDTSGFVNIDVIDPILDNTDLVLLDLKHMIEEESKELTGVGVEKSLKLAKHLDERNIPVWIRHVLLPGITDNKENLEALGEFVSKLNNVERFEFLPYHSIGVHKWESMGLNYELKNIEDATSEDVAKASEIVEKFGVKVFNSKSK